LGIIQPKNLIEMATITTTTAPTTAQDMYIQYCGSWIIGSHTREADQLLSTLPAEGGANGRKFAQYLRKHKIGKRVSNITNLMPELQAIALNY
jgi:hypothetical protein